MECPKCKGKINDQGDIDAKFTANEREVDLIITCPKCDSRYFTFIKVDDLTPDE